MALSIRRWDDPTSWNTFVASVPWAHFQQSWEWGDLAPDLGGRAVRLAAVRDDVMVGAVQLFVNRLSRTGSTILYVPRGPALRALDYEILGRLLEGAREVGRAEGAIGIRLEPNIPAASGAWKSALSSLGFRASYPPSQPRSSWVLDITPDADSILAQMKQKTRYNIRLAGKKGVEVTEAGPEDLAEFYALFQETARRDGFFIHSQDVYERMYRLFWDASTFAMLFARHQGNLIAAVTLVHFGSTCWYLQGASSNEHRNLMAPYLLQWKGIEWAKAQACSEYDFRAVPDLLQEDQDMYGVYRFKEGFGGHQFTTLHTYAQPYHRGMFGLWQMFFSGRFAYQEWRRHRQGLPARQFA
jgi:peptidoglycan pentaglycine glycine transferase (the first glycine)